MFVTLDLILDLIGCTHPNTHAQSIFWNFFNNGALWYGRLLHFNKVMFSIQIWPGKDNVYTNSSSLWTFWHLLILFSKKQTHTCMLAQTISAFVTFSNSYPFIVLLKHIPKSRYIFYFKPHVTPTCLLFSIDFTCSAHLFIIFCNFVCSNHLIVIFWNLTYNTHFDPLAESATGTGNERSCSSTVSHGYIPVIAWWCLEYSYSKVRRWHFYFPLFFYSLMSVFVVKVHF